MCRETNLSMGWFHALGIAPKRHQPRSTHGGHEHLPGAKRAATGVPGQTK